MIAPWIVYDLQQLKSPFQRPIHKRWMINDKTVVVENNPLTHEENIL